MEKTITIILGIISIALFSISLMHLYEKGYLMNNAYIYASKEERETLNKRPYYRQSGIVFFLFGLIALLNAFNVELKSFKLFIFIILLVVFTIVYAIISTKKIEKNNR